MWLGCEDVFVSGDGRCVVPVIFVVCYPIMVCVVWFLCVVLCFDMSIFQICCFSVLHGFGGCVMCGGLMFMI